MLPVVRAAAAWKVGFPLQIPTVLERTSALSTEVPYRVYKLDEGKTVRFTFAKSGNEYWGIQETNWDDAPALADKNLSQVIQGRQYDLYFNGPHLHMVVLRAGGASYWVVNTLLDSISNETMLAIAKGLRLSQVDLRRERGEAAARRLRGRVGRSRHGRLLRRARPRGRRPRRRAREGRGAARRAGSRSTSPGSRSCSSGTGAADVHARRRRAEGGARVLLLLCRHAAALSGDADLSAFGRWSTTSAMAGARRSS